MRIVLKSVVLCLVALPFAARAQEVSVPNSNWFVGLGGSVNSLDYDLDMFASGDADIFQNDQQVATGSARGPANPRNETDWSLAPEAQLGYMARLSGSNWLMGAKFQYQYIDSTVSTHDIVPQAGAVTTMENDVIPFTGNVLIGQYRTKLEHQLAFMPFVGHAFGRSYVYAGAGPALFGTKTNVDNAIGFADFEGERHDVTGPPESYASSEWVWGGAAQIGLAYYLDDGWFLDVNYTYARSAKFGSHYSSPFANTPAGYDVEGTLFIDPSQRVTNQSVGITINKAF